MSAFVVDPKTINTILGFLNSKAQEIPHIQKRLQQIEWDIEDAENLTDLGQAMYNLNINAVSQRYPNCTERDLPGTGEENGQLVPYQFHWESASPIQAFKSLQCWLYQCCEGNVTETALYKTFDDILNFLAEIILTALPEYEKAVWG